MIFPILIPAAYGFTWLMFPEIGGTGTSLALGPKASYAWPIFFSWYMFVVLFSTDPPAKGETNEGADRSAGTAAKILVVVLIACWGFWIWHAIGTSKSEFVSAFLPFFVMVLGGLPVLIGYWVGMLASVVLFVTCIPRFIAGIHYLIVPHPAGSLVRRARFTAIDAKTLAYVMRKNRPDAANPPPAFVSKNFERKAHALAKRLHAEVLLGRNFVERVRREAAKEEKNR